MNYKEVTYVSHLKIMCLLSLSVSSKQNCCQRPSVKRTVNKADKKHFVSLFTYYGYLDNSMARCAGVEMYVR